MSVELTLTSEKERGMMEMVFPLADALCMKLNLYPKTQQISGHMDIHLPIIEDVELQVQPKVMASMVTLQDAALLIKLRKRVWLYAWHNRKGKTVSIQILDAKALDLTESKSINALKGRSAEQSSMAYARGTKASFQKSLSSNKWKRVDDAFDSLDAGQEKRS